MGWQWLDAVTQWWVRASGRNFDPGQDAWLMAPSGDVAEIGEKFFHDMAAKQGWTVDDASSGRGLIDSMSSVASASFDPTCLNPAVVAFYERTSDYSIDAWSEWRTSFRPFGWLLAILFSRRLQQLNVPLSGLDASRGMTSKVLKIRDADGQVKSTAWVRKLVATGHVIYAGDYSVGPIPGLGAPGIRVTFPLPNGNAIVLMKAEALEDGSLRLSSVGRRFGDAGFYFTVHRPRYWARYVKHMKETIHVYPVDDKELRADHDLKLFGMTFLKLHYRLRSETR